MIHIGVSQSSGSPEAWGSPLTSKKLGGSSGVHVCPKKVCVSDLFMGKAAMLMVSSDLPRKHCAFGGEKTQRCTPEYHMIIGYNQIPFLYPMISPFSL